VTLSLDEISILDRQTEQLYDFKPIPEHEVKVLCDKAKEILQGESNV
jgi:serine/threonine-protein phosphatase 2A catalytic subunit